MGAQVFLEVEVGQAVGLAELQELAQLVVGKDVATVGGVLQLVSADVLVDLAGHFSACHLSALGLAEEASQFSADQGGLYEAGRLAVRVGSAALAGVLLSNADLAFAAGAQGAELTSDGSDLAAHRGQLTQQSGECISEGRLSDDIVGGGGGCFHRCGSRGFLGGSGYFGFSGHLILFLLLYYI